MIKSKAKHFFFLYFLCYDNIYLTNWVLVLAEERLEFEAFGRGQRSDLGVGRQGHRGRLWQQAVEQPQQGEGNQTAVRGSSSGRTGMIQQKNKNKQEAPRREKRLWPYLPISPVVRMRVLRSSSSRLTLALFSASLRRETRSLSERARQEIKHSQNSPLTFLSNVKMQSYRKEN